MKKARVLVASVSKELGFTESELFLLGSLGNGFEKMADILIRNEEHY